MHQIEWVRLLSWSLTAAFFIVAPAIVVYGAMTMLHFLDDPSHPSDIIGSFDREKAQLLLTFYAGTVGGLIAYGYGRTQLHLPSDTVHVRITKLLTAALLGVALFLFINSAVFVRLFYPKLFLEMKDANLEIDIHTVLLAAVVAGLFGPSAISKIEKNILP
jgi:hypothetical protein